MRTGTMTARSGESWISPHQGVPARITYRVTVFGSLVSARIQIDRPGSPSGLIYRVLSCDQVLRQPR